MTKTKVMNWLQKNTMILILVLVVLFFTWQTGGKILLPQNITNLIAQNAYVFILATGMLLCILTGGNIDLSVGSVVCFTGAVGALLMASGMNMWLAVAAMLGIGLVIGGLQAFCIAYIHVPPFITTVAGQLIFRGLSNVILNGRTQTVNVQAFTDIFGGGASCYVPDLLGGNGINMLCVLVGILACAAYLFVTFRNRANRSKKGYTLEPIAPVIVRFTSMRFGKRSQPGPGTFSFSSSRDHEGSKRNAVPSFILPTAMSMSSTLSPSRRFGATSA